VLCGRDKNREWNGTHWNYILDKKIKQVISTDEELAASDTHWQWLVERLNETT
jgi:hypothetical protein